MLADCFRLFSLLNVASISEATYYYHQRAIIRTVQTVYHAAQSTLLSRVVGPMTLGGDARWDGHRLDCCSCGWWCGPEPVITVASFSP